MFPNFRWRRTCLVARYSPTRGCEFDVRCHWADLPQESASRTSFNTRNRGLKKPTHLCETGQINQRQIQHIGAVYPERYRQLANALVLPCHPESLLLYLLPNLVEVRKPLVYVEKLRPFSVWWSVGRRFGRYGCVNQLKNERSSRYDALASR